MLESFNDLKNAQRILRNKFFHSSLKEFHGFHPAYMWTNENIDNYLKIVDFDNVQNGLCVLSSGDHAFSLIDHGILDVATFDCNRFTEYYVLGLKRAMILKYNYQEFLYHMQTFSSLQPQEFLNILLDTYHLMDHKYRHFWIEIGNFIYKENIGIFNLFLNVAPNKFNLFFQNAERYQVFKSNLNKANITFVNCDVAELNKHFHEQYDVILLSNILDYMQDCWGNNWDYSQLAEFEQSLAPLMKKDGILFLYYIFHYYMGTMNLFNSSLITGNSLKNEEIISVKNFLGMEENAVILKRYK